MKISLESDNIGLKKTFQKVVKELGLVIDDQDPNIKIIDLDSELSHSPDKAEIIIYAGNLKRLKNKIKEGEQGEEFEYIILPVDESELEAVIKKAINHLKMREEFNQALRESIEYYNTFLEMKKSMKLLELSDPDIKVNEILAFLEIEIGQSGIEIWLYDFDEKHLNLAGYTGTVLQRGKLPSRIKSKFSATYGPIIYEKSTLIPLTQKGKIFGIIRFQKKLNENQIKKIMVYREFLSMALFNSLKHFYKKRELSNYIHKGVLKKEILREFIEKHLHQSQRYSSPLSFILFKLENRDILEDMFQNTFAKKWEKFISNIAQTLRTSDVIGEYGENSYLIILTNTDYMGAISYLRRFKNLLKTHSVFSTKEKTGEMKIRYNVASFPIHGRVWSEIEQHLYAGIDEKLNPYFRLNVKNLSFEESIDYLKTMVLKEKLKKGSERLEPAMWLPKEEDIINVTYLLINELIANGNKGAGYINLPWLSNEKLINIIETYIDNGNDKNFPLFFFTSDKKISSSIGYGKKYIITSNSDVIKKISFIFLLSQLGSYMAIFQQNEDFFTAIHCSDTLLVEELIEKLQRRFYLKPAV